MVSYIMKAGLVFSLCVFLLVGCGTSKRYKSSQLTPTKIAILEDTINFVFPDDMEFESFYYFSFRNAEFTLLANYSHSDFRAYMNENPQDFEKKDYGYYRQPETIHENLVISMKKIDEIDVIEFKSIDSRFDFSSFFDAK